MLKLCFTYIKCFTVMKLPASLYPLNRTHCKLHSSNLGDLISRGRSFWQSDWSKTWRQSSPPPGRALGSDKHGGRSRSLSLCLWAGPSRSPFASGRPPEPPAPLLAHQGSGAGAARETRLLVRVFTTAD